MTSPVEKIYKGDTVQLVATAKDADGNVLPGKAATWSSDSPESFPVSSGGEIQSLGQGAVDRDRPHRRSVQQSAAHDAFRSWFSMSVGAKEVVLDGTTERCEGAGRRRRPGTVRASGRREPGDVLR